MAVIGKLGRLTEFSKWEIHTPEYQREVDEARVRRYARDFSWFLFGVLYLEYRPSDQKYYAVDGLHRLSAARARDDVATVPSIVFDFEGPQQAAEVFVMLQRYRRPLKVQAIQHAELFAGGEFGELARRAQTFIAGLSCERVPLATIRKLWRQRPDAFDRIANLVDPLASPGALNKDLIEAMVYAEDLLMPEESLATTYREAMFNLGPSVLLAGIRTFLDRHREAQGLTSKGASPRLKAEGLLATLRGQGYRRHDLFDDDGEPVGSQILPPKAAE